MKRIAQWSLYGSLAAVVLVAFLILCGEETPGRQISDRMFFGTKISAGAVIYICYLAGKYFDRRGWLPGIKEPEDKITNP